MNVKLLLALALALCSAPLLADDLATQFANPPASARPWVYWFWNNGNVNKTGITADLEAMQRVGIGGVIIMDVVERFAPPPGTADFMNAEWQDLFDFAVSEAHRLGLKINMTNGPGWCGSSGPWITPELSMQMLVTTNVAVTGPVYFSAVLPEPDTDGKRAHDGFDSTVKYDHHFYRDIALLAFPITTNGAVAPDAVLNLTTNLDANGKLNWEVPAGQWIIERIGHTTTGSSTRPPVKGGNGLECDKLSAEAVDVHFTNMMGKLIAKVGPLAGKTLVATHIDSWEVGSQNWTPKFREEFQKRRGYDPLPYLPNVTGTASHLAIGDPAVAVRFRWDFDQTRAELLAENYVGELARLAHQYGLRLTLEGYDLPFGDEATYTQRADEPMTEFWATGGNQNAAKGRQMASVAHIMGERIVGAEAFTSGDSEQWKFTPATIKALGDYEFSQGVNRFVIHRYAFQPYLDRFPGSTMGPWGLHYERTQTWWEMSTAWHKYLTRCQYMLRQGMFVADLCYLRPQLPNQTYFTPDPAVPAGYKYDECSAEALIARMKVKNGRLVLPDGMSYRLLVLPQNVTLMTPALVQKIKELAAAGATVLGPRPTASPSLSGFPECDQEVAQLAAEVWGDCDGKTVTEHNFGSGKVIWGQPLATVLRQLQTPPDFTASTQLNWIHRQVGDQQVYFLANEKAGAVEAQCHFRVSGLHPELWNPETGEISSLAMYVETNGEISIPIHLEGSGSTFIVFSPQNRSFDPATSFTRNGRPVVALTEPPVIEIRKASYGVPGDASRTRDVRSKLQAIVNGGEIDFQVASLAKGDDPAFGIVKTLVAEYTVDGEPHKISGQDPDTINLVASQAATDRVAEIRCGQNGKLRIEARARGCYDLKTASGKALRVEITNVPAPLEITGAWQVSFPPKWGAPDHIVLNPLASWSDSTNAGVKYFSGTATYTKTFDWNPGPPTGNVGRKITLDLGDVAVMAQVKLNGHDLGILWRSPFRVNATSALQSGKNTLEIRVANLWPNRMIGDAALPVAKRFTWSSYEPFTKDMPLLKSGLLGPVRLITAEISNAVRVSKSVSANPPDSATMTRIYGEVKTPFKYGVVLKGAGTNELVDCPSVFRSGNHWYMMYVAITNKVGYQTFLARSDDLLHWDKLGEILSFTATNHWDAWQADGGVALCDYRLDGSHELEKFDGKYWLSYIGGAKQGYETDPLSLGLAWTKSPTKIQEWNRIPENPILSGKDADAREFEKKTLYKSQIIHDASESLGFPFVMFYNGKHKNGYERIGMAVSRDMIHWMRYGETPVVANGVAKKNGISGDPQIVKIGDVWVMFYFGAGWNPHAFDTFACSYDLVHWTKWTGANLVEPSEPYDKTYAHKPWVVKWNGVVYHFYCAVGNEGRVIAVATSKDLRP